MLNSIREEIYLSYLDYETSERVIWLFDWPGMVVLCVSQIYWSLEVENCLVDHAVFALELLHEKLKSQILKLVDLVRGLYILHLYIISIVYIQYGYIVYIYNIVYIIYLIFYIYIYIYIYIVRI